MLLKILQILQENTCVGVSFKQTCFFNKTPTQVFSCEICEIFKNIAIPILKNSSEGLLLRGI